MALPSGHLGGPPSRPTPELRVTVTPGTALVAAVLVLLVVGAWNTIISARSVLATALAAAIVAVLVSGPIEIIGRRLGRVAAVVVTAIAIFGAIGGAGFAVYDDVNRAFERLEEEAPRAAAELEESTRFGDVATDLRLRARVTDAIERVRTGAEDRVRGTAFRAANYFVATILTLFFLIYGPRIYRGGLAQITAPARRARIERILWAAVSHTRSYLGLEILHAAAAGLVAGLVFHGIGLPGASGLALLVALGAFIPDIGLGLGATPALLLTAAFEPLATFVALIFVVLVAQAAEAWFAHRRDARGSHVGPALTLLGTLLGFAIYGVGGAVFSVPLVVFGSALVDALGDEREAELALPPGDPPVE